MIWGWNKAWLPLQMIGRDKGMWPCYACSVSQWLLVSLTIVSSWTTSIICELEALLSALPVGMVWDSNTEWLLFGPLRVMLWCAERNHLLNLQSIQSYWGWSWGDLELNIFSILMIQLSFCHVVTSESGMIQGWCLEAVVVSEMVSGSRKTANMLQLNPDKTEALEECTCSRQGCTPPEGM